MNELNKRIVTSFFLLLVFLSCLMINKFTWLFLLIIVSSISFFEIKKIIRIIFKKNLFFFIFVLISLIYVIFFTISAYSLLIISSEIFILYILSICICSDIGGYVVGKSVGGKKLTKISPNKTISGSFGSFIFSLIPFIVILIFKKSELKIDFNEFSIFLTIISSFFISLLCQVGDLIISFFKRLSKVKDTGNILPGHGGILDRIDGIIFAIPIIYLVSTFIK
tara:strand:- start:957 stop:1625 length:669 start_codon:yes stop_codon:yes gene_type:complete